MELAPTRATWRPSALPPPASHGLSRVVLVGAGCRTTVLDVGDISCRDTGLVAWFRPITLRANGRWAWSSPVGDRRRVPQPRPVGTNLRRAACAVRSTPEVEMAGRRR